MNLLATIIIECHKWFIQDKKMTLSEEKAAEKFTLKYYVQNSNCEDQKKDLIWCLNFATEAHKDQKRKDIELTPYINHPIGVAYIISEEAGVNDLDLIRGCLLHDTVEDTSVVIEVIQAKFGDYIGDLVEEVTDDKTLPKQKRKDLQIVHARTTSPQGKMVKLADKLYNLRDLERSLPRGWTEDRRKEYYEWAFQVCKGLRGVSPRLEAKLDELFQRLGLISEREPGFDSAEYPVWADHNELKPLLAAANFAAERHSHHFTLDAKNCVPFINHVVSVTFIVSQEAEIQDITVLCAALLHAVVGKTDTKLQEILNTFGQEVGQLVAELTYNYSCSVEEQFKSQMNRVADMSQNARVITLAAVIDKCRRLEVFEPEGWTPELRESYFRWSQQLCTLLSGTQPNLEEELGHIWVGQGLATFPVYPKKAPQSRW